MIDHFVSDLNALVKPLERSTSYWHESRGEQSPSSSGGPTQVCHAKQLRSACKVCVTVRIDQISGGGGSQEYGRSFLEREDFGRRQEAQH